jgi:hypothetical protein
MNTITGVPPSAAAKVMLLRSKLITLTAVGSYTQVFHRSLIDDIIGTDGGGLVPLHTDSMPPKIGRAMPRKMERRVIAGRVGSSYRWMV